MRPTLAIESSLFGPKVSFHQSFNMFHTHFGCSGGKGKPRLVVESSSFGKTLVFADF